MEFASPSRRRTIGNRRIVKVEIQTDANCHNLNLYLHPVSETISLLEFQELGRKRLEVLKKIETLKERHGSSREEYRREYLKEISELMPLATGICPLDKLTEARRQDRISHFILRLAFCQKPEHTDWFVKQETELFRMRFHLETISSVRSFLALNNIILDAVDAAEKSTLAAELSQAHTMSIDSVMKTDFFKMNFDEVYELLLSFKVYLKLGIAYVAANDLLALLAPRFRSNLFTSMAMARRHIGFLQEEERLTPLLKQLASRTSGYRNELLKTRNANDVTPDMIDNLARTSFPLCMRRIHYHMQAEHHLRHFARFQYGLFLQGIGCSVESTLEYFRQGFASKCTAEKFNKNYAYNIRHIYGKEGKRQTRKPLNCASIVLGSAPAAPEDCHGCPYRHLETRELQNRLESLGLNAEQIHHINDYTRANRYDKACTLFFEITHNMEEGSLGTVITHPNEYYELSRQRLAPSAQPSTATDLTKPNANAMTKRLLADENVDPAASQALPKRRLLADADAACTDKEDVIDDSVMEAEPSDG